MEGEIYLGVEEIYLGLEEIKTVDVIIRQNIKSLYMELMNAGNIKQINGLIKIFGQNFFLSKIFGVKR